MSAATSILSLASPSLVSSRDERAHEVKFLLADGVGRAVEDWARGRLTLDPHGDPALDGAYRTTSLYFDTPEMDVYRRSTSYRRRKFRLRKYGSADCIYAEKKSKWGDRVAKVRAAIAQDELSYLARPLSIQTWPGHWFHRQLLARRLRPACRIAYQRTAFVGTSTEGPVRLTIDRCIRGVPAAGWDLPSREEGLPLLPEQVILELKFRTAMPAVFKELVADFRLSPAGISKYRRFHEAWGERAETREVAHA